jgi:hypothetical protein
MMLSYARIAQRGALLAPVCAVLSAWPLANAWGVGAGGPDGVPHGLPWEVSATPAYSATLEQCISSTVPVQRSVTFTGQMVAVAGTQRMGMRIVLQQRAGGDEAFHDVEAPTLGIWRYSEPGVRIYRYVKQITNLSAPAAYRAVVRFRWTGDRGRVVKHAVLRTASCAQTAPAQSAPAGASSA